MVLESYTEGGSVCGYEQTRDVCITCEFLHKCAFGKRLVKRTFAHHHPDRLLEEFIMLRGEWDTVQQELTKTEVVYYSKKYRETVERQRSELGL